MADTYFADAFYWIAVTHSKDAWHRGVVNWQRAHASARLVTTEEVLGEFLTWFSSKGRTLRHTAARVARSVLENQRVQVLAQTSTGFHEALALYESRLDKAYSLTDCRSMVAMRQLGLTEVLTNDRHFGQEGFNILFP